LVAKGKSVEIGVIAKGPGKENFKYQWRRADNALPSTANGENTQSLTITSVTSHDGGSYYCVVTNQWRNVVESDRATVNVLGM